MISVVFCDSPPKPDVKFGLAAIWDRTQIPVGASVTYRCTNLMRLTSNISSATFELPCLESNNGYFDKNASWPTCALSKLCKVKSCSFVLKTAFTPCYPSVVSIDLFWVCFVPFLYNGKALIHLNILHCMKKNKMREKKSNGDYFFNYDKWSYCFKRIK